MHKKSAFSDQAISADLNFHIKYNNLIAILNLDQRWTDSCYEYRDYNL
jgi:hypothetical protein